LEFHRRSSAAGGLTNMTKETDSAVSPVSDEAEVEPIDIAGVDGQVTLAIDDMDDAEKKNPAWLWFENEHNHMSLGRWASVPCQAPYVRGDLVADAMRALSRRSLDTADGVEPVAWRWNWGAGGRWFYDEERPSDQDAKSPYFGKLTTIEPLYASRTPNTEMVVKALEWFEGFAQTPFGEYGVNPYDDIGGRGWVWSFDDREHGNFATEIEACAAAQSDFDQRIRSALASPPSPAPGRTVYIAVDHTGCIHSDEDMERVIDIAKANEASVRRSSPAEVTVTDEMVFAAMTKADELGEPLDDIDAREILTAALQLNKKG
jgi:hypothetical protein